MHGGTAGIPIKSPDCRSDRYTFVVRFADSLTTLILSAPMDKQSDFTFEEGYWTPSNGVTCLGVNVGRGIRKSDPALFDATTIWQHLSFKGVFVVCRSLAGV